VIVPMAIEATSPSPPPPSVWRVPLSPDDLELLQALVSLHARGQRGEVVRARLGELERKLRALRAGA
jgi:hypothetical protein